MVRRVVLAAALLLATAAPRAAGALDLAENPERSFFLGFELGAGADLQPAARLAEEDDDGAYSPAGFLYGVWGGYRFNEVVGVEAGLRQCRHAAPAHWGGAAGYTLGHVALRLAIPTPSRLTAVFDLGGAIGSFFYGAVDGIEENRTLAVGGLAGFAIEHELGPAIVGRLALAYLPLWRRAMGELVLVEVGPDGAGVVEDRLDLGGARAVHLLWTTLGIQFDWVIR